MDSTGTIVSAIQNACVDLSIPVPGEYDARQIIGLGLTQALQTLLPNLLAHDYPRLVERYRYHYLGEDHRIPLFDGVAAAMPALVARGHTLAVATGKNQVGLMRALDVSGLKPHFTATRCADQTHSKPHPAMVLELIDELDADPARTLVIGDTSHDMQMAESAGVARLGVSYGAHEVASLSRHTPLAILNSFAEVQAWLLANA